METSANLIEIVRASVFKELCKSLTVASVLKY